MKPLLIVQTGHAPDSIRARLGDFPHWFRLCLKLPRERLRVMDVQRDDALPPPRMCAGALITGSAAMVTEQTPWMRHTGDWIRRAMDADLPLLGVCFGHQLMAQALGGEIGALPGGREMGTEWIELNAEATHDVLLNKLPPRFRAHTTHVQSVLRVPGSATVLASSRREPHQILRYGAHAISCQFHPEFSTRAMRAYIRLRADQLREEGFVPKDLLRAVTAAPHAKALVRAFAMRIDA